MKIFMSKLVPNIRSKGYRDCVRNNYITHAILLKAFGAKRDESMMLFSEKDNGDIIVQSNIDPEWKTLGDFLVNYQTKSFETEHLRIKKGLKIHFVIDTSPSKRCLETQKMVNITKFEDQKQWLIERGEKNGFIVEKIYDICNTSKKLVASGGVCGFKKTGSIKMGVKQFKGILVVKDREKFINCLTKGIGKGKAFGLGMLNISK